MKSKKNKLDKMFGVRDWSILLKYVYFYVPSFHTYVRSSDGPHNWANGNERGGACMSVTHERSVSACEHAAITHLRLFTLARIISLGIL